jgi:hypothetical protein
MSSRPRDLAERISRESDLLHETFRLPLADARSKAREILSAQGRCIENWRQLPDGQIEFTARRVLAPD